MTAKIRNAHKNQTENDQFFNANTATGIPLSQTLGTYSNSTYYDNYYQFGPLSDHNKITQLVKSNLQVWIHLRPESELYRVRRSRLRRHRACLCRLRDGLRGPTGDVYVYAHTQYDVQGSYRIAKGLEFVAYGLNLSDEAFGFYQGSPIYPIQREFYHPTVSIGLRWTSSAE